MLIIHNLPNACIMSRSLQIYQKRDTLPIVKVRNFISLYISISNNRVFFW